ncbi:hypothetical protein EGJ22_17905, partial [Pseudomonas sp. p99-361]
AMRRAGGARSNRRCIPCGKHLSALMRSLWEPACRRLGSKAAPAMARSALALTATSPMPLPLIYHEDYSPEFPAEHRFPMDKFRLRKCKLCSEPFQSLPSCPSQCPIHAFQADVKATAAACIVKKP